MVFVLELLAVLAIFGVLLTDYWVITDLEREKRENIFVSQQKGKQKDPNLPIPLAFNRQDTDFLMRLCKHYRFVRRSRRRYPDPPHIQTHYIGTKKIGYSPFKADVIRCSEEYAIVDAGDEHCAYVLRKGRSKKYIDATTFYLYAKFCYQRYIKDGNGVGASTEGEPTTIIEAESNNPKTGGFRKIVQNMKWKKG